MKDYQYADVGQQFLWLIDEHSETYAHITAVPTGWYMMLEENGKYTFHLIPDKDHTMNPRACIPAGWQDGTVPGAAGKTEHQARADALWETVQQAGASRVLTSKHIFEGTVRILSPDVQAYIENAQDAGGAIQIKDPGVFRTNFYQGQGSIAQTGTARTITVHKYARENETVDVEIAHHSDGLYSLRMGNGHYRPANIDQFHYFMRHLGYERVAYHTVKCNTKKNKDANPFIHSDTGPMED